MSSNYWLKLYHEMLYDPKVCRLDDHLYRRFIECLLAAGDRNQAGTLPPVKEFAWTLRTSEEELETDLIELQRHSLLSNIENEWIVTNFAKRQSAMSASERGKRFRDRQRKQEYYGPVTEPERNTNDSFADIDKDIDKIKKKNIRAPSPSSLNPNPQKALTDSTGIIAWPASQSNWIDNVIEMINQRGHKATVAVMKDAFDDWRSRKTNDGRSYNPMNFTWIEWAQRRLLGLEEPEMDPSDMNKAQFDAWLERGAKKHAA